MFEKVVLNRSSTGSAITLGELAEALLYYKSVHIVLNQHSVQSYLTDLGAQGFLSLLARPNVTAVYCDDAAGIQTKNNMLGSEYQFVTYWFGGSKDEGQARTARKRLQLIFKRSGCSEKWAKKYTQRLRDVAPIRRLRTDHFVKDGVIKAAEYEIKDQEFVKEAVRLAVLREFGDELVPSDFFFDVVQVGDAYKVNTNLDFDAINVVWRKRNPGSKGSIKPGRYLNAILSATVDSVLSARYGGEFYTSELNSEITKIKHAELLRRFELDKKELGQFIEVVLPDLPSVREVINSGQRSFDEFLTLLDKAEKFKDWIGSVSPDENLVKNYLQEAASQGWIAKARGRTVRYGLTSGITAVSPPIGTMLGVLDALLLE